MANLAPFTTLALNLLRGRINPNPITDREKFITQLQVKFRTYYLEYEINSVLPYEDSGEKVFDKKASSILLVDDCGNK
ncbi:DNA helicase [Trifolium repens]|nr:DNA helicase [Trifolium repens]